MRHPQVAPVGVVLDEHEGTAGLEVRAHQLEDRALVLHEVQRVRHEHAIHAAQAERAREVRGPLLEPDGGKASLH